MCSQGVGICRCGIGMWTIWEWGACGCDGVKLGMFFVWKCGVCRPVLGSGDAVCLGVECVRVCVDMVGYGDVIRLRVGCRG